MPAAFAIGFIAATDAWISGQSGLGIFLLHWRLLGQGSSCSTLARARFMARVLASSFRFVAAVSAGYFFLK
jgi:hypothetical protein